MNARFGADGLVKATLSVSDAPLRVAYLASVAGSWPLSELARCLDELCRRAEQAETAAREVLISLIDALNGEQMSALVQRLREEAVGESLWALERLVRQPGSLGRGASSSSQTKHEVAEARHVPGMLQDPNGRPLTLGERKSLARRPDRDLLQRLLGDPHPDVIRRCLRSPRLTEEDVVPLAAKRPGRAGVLAEIARSRWVHRPRIRLALVLNPSTPPELAVRITGLLLRHELTMVAQTPAAPAGVRAVCLEHLARRPPLSARGERGVH